MKSVFPCLPAVFAVALFASSAGAAVPVGYLDAASCDTIAGWAQDPDEPTKAIDVHIYMGGPAGSGAPAVGINANAYRGDLCTAIGSCEHGFGMAPPLSLLDGNPRDIYTYGIDTGGEGNPLLGNAPKQLVCPPPAQSGVRRKIASVPAYDAWRFSSFWDLLPLPADQADLLPEGPAFPEEPELLRADDGSAEVWLVDHGVRRNITAVAGAWRMDLATAKTVPLSEVQALVEGPPLRGRPVVFIHGALFVVDDAIPEVPGEASASSSSSSGGWGGDEGGGGADPGTGAVSSGGSCSVQAAAAGGGNDRWFVGALLLTGLVFTAERRRGAAARGQ